MERYILDNYDVAVIGAGHAGIEAALASARLGAKTVLFTMSIDAVGNMPCNPSIGGTAKGHLVCEIDALGGEMGKAADETFIQSRMLNKGKGPAVHSLRAQIDRNAYHRRMKKAVENQKGLCMKQAEIVDIIQDENNKVTGVQTALGATYSVGAVIVCCGTYLNSVIHIGSNHISSGPDGMHAAKGLTENLCEKGVELRRFKTGTPARVHKRSIDFSVLEEQLGDEPVTPFSFQTNPENMSNKVACHIAYTNEQTHKVIMENLHRSPLYGGQIEGTGPRYCPSIEDKVVRFADKLRHQIFVEPLGMDTEEMYLQGVSSSLPEDVQIALYQTIKGFENIEIMRNAYAIEYDCINPLILAPTLEFKSIEGMYGAGQFNGTSGYEEAAAQGLIAGINAARKVQGKEEVILERSGSYIGTLIDDLVTKGCNDPYRMMTSRSEYRLILRQDNADIRLTKQGYEIGLISKERYMQFCEKCEAIEQEKKRLERTVVSPTKALCDKLELAGTAALTTGARLSELLKRPQVDYEMLREFDEGRTNLSLAVINAVQIQIKYEGYIRKQLSQVEQMQRLEHTLLPEKIDYNTITGLRLEAREKLSKIRPHNLGRASRISGVSPADISVLIIYLSKKQ